MPTVIRKGAKPQVVVRLTAEEIKDMLLSLPDNERVFVTSNPESGSHRVMNIKRNAAGNLEYEYEQIPE